MHKAIVLHNSIALWLISFGVTKLKKIKKKNIAHNAEAAQRLP
jgi:hypothetical protein